MNYANILQRAVKGAKNLGQTYPATSTVGMIGGTGLAAASLGKAIETALEPSEKKENPLEFKKKQIESTYNYEFTERNNENNLSYMPEMYIEDNRLVVKLNDEPKKHANYINMYAAQSAFGQDNRDIVYEIDGKKHAYDFSVFGGAKFIPLENMENNPFTKDLPSANQMMPEDFR